MSVWDLPDSDKIVEVFLCIGLYNMAEKTNTKTKFGRLLQQYREAYSGPQHRSLHTEIQGLSQFGLELLLIENDYYITSGLVNKYEFGKRTPPPKFIRKVAEVLILDDEQTDALIEAHFADYKVNFWTEYNSDSIKD